MEQAHLCLWMGFQIYECVPPHIPEINDRMAVINHNLESKVTFHYTHSVIMRIQAALRYSTNIKVSGLTEAVLKSCVVSQQSGAEIVRVHVQISTQNHHVRSSTSVPLSKKTASR